MCHKLVPGRGGTILSEALENVTAESGSMIIIEENEDDDVVEKEGNECNVTEKVKVSDGSDKLEEEVQEPKADVDAILSEVDRKSVV